MNTSSPTGSVVTVTSIVFLLTALFFNSASETMAKLLVMAGLTSPMVLWARFLAQFVLVLVYCGVREGFGVLKTPRLGLHVLRSTVVVVAGLTGYAALRSLQLFEFISIMYTVPIFTVVIGRVFLREHVEPQRWFAVAGGMVGILIITRPGVGALNAGHLLALGTALCYCVFTVMTRTLGHTERTETLMFYPAAVSVAALSVFIPGIVEIDLETTHWVLFGVIGLSGTAAHVLTIRAYRIASASGLAPYFYFQIIWVLALGFLVFADLPDAWMVTGAAVIILSGIYLVNRDRKATMPDVGV